MPSTLRFTSIYLAVSLGLIVSACTNTNAKNECVPPDVSTIDKNASDGGIVDDSAFPEVDEEACVAASSDLDIPDTPMEKFLYCFRPCNSEGTAHEAEFQAKIAEERANCIKNRTDLCQLGCNNNGNPDSAGDCAPEAIEQECQKPFFGSIWFDRGSPECDRRSTAQIDEDIAFENFCHASSCDYGCILSTAITYISCD